MNATAAMRFQLDRTPFGKLVLTNAEGEVFEGVVPVRAFPVQSPDDGIGMVNTEGREVAWIDKLGELPEPAQTLVRQELATREFMPVIQKIASVTSFSTPCTWKVETDRGDTQFVLRGDEDIRRIGTDGALLVADSHGIQFLIRDQHALNAHSRKILDRFL
ncbi:MAG: hypothetical protein RIR45_838 [Pseudomonadota bacterium]|jgi:hypothetical protein